MNKIFKLALVAFALFVSVTFIMSYRDSIKAEGTVDVTFQADKSEIKRGENISYTFDIKNNTASDLTNVVALITLDNANVTYVPGSGKLVKPDKEIAIPDAWVSDRVNMGTMKPDQSNKVLFQVKVNNDTAVGFQIKTSGEIRPEGLDSIVKYVVTTVVTDQDKSVFDTGDQFKAVNNSLSETNWRDQVNASMGNVIQYKFHIVNKGPDYSRNTTVHIQLSWDPKQLKSILTSTATVDADNAEPFSDSQTVTVGNGATYMWPYDGHYAINGVTDLYNCPNGCELPKNFLWGPMNIGRIQPGGVVEVAFKASVVGIMPTPTPTHVITPTPTPTVTVTVTPTPTITVTPTPTTTGTPNECGGTCGSNFNCQGGLFCFEGFCRNPNIVVNGKYVCSTTVTPTPSTPSVLGAVAPVAPKTGAGLAELTLGLLTTGAIGFGLRRLAHNIW